MESGTYVDYRDIENLNLPRKCQQNTCVTMTWQQQANLSLLEECEPLGDETAHRLEEAWRCKDKLQQHMDT